MSGVLGRRAKKPLKQTYTKVKMEGDLLIQYLDGISLHVVKSNQKLCGQKALTTACLK
jgi:hypothetical protein